MRWFLQRVELLRALPERIDEWVTDLGRSLRPRLNLLRELHHNEAMVHALTHENDRLRRENAEAALLLSALGREAVGE